MGVRPAALQELRKEKSRALEKQGLPKQCCQDAGNSSAPQ
jgi:hypothetical protein